MTETSVHLRRAFMQLLQISDIIFMQKYRLRKSNVKIIQANIQLPASFCVIDDCKTKTLPIAIQMQLKLGLECTELFFR